MSMIYFCLSQMSLFPQNNDLICYKQPKGSNSPNNTFTSTVRVIHPDKKEEAENPTININTSYCRGTNVKNYTKLIINNVRHVLQSRIKCVQYLTANILFHHLEILPFINQYNKPCTLPAGIWDCKL